MNRAPTEAPVPGRVRFDLEVQPERAGTRWHASLLVRATGARADFDSPLQLLRYLARLTLDERQGGLR